MNNTTIDIEYLVNEIEHIMSDHSPMEAMFNDVFQDIDTDIPLQSCTNKWKNLLQAYQMNYDDFICNVLMAILSEICADISIKEKISYNNTSDKQVRTSQKKIVETKENIYGKALYEQQPYFENVKKKNLSSFFHTELFLVLHEEIDRSKYLRNPLLKLATSGNINIEHFSSTNLNEIIAYYKSICKYITGKTNKITNFNKILILYHLEVETRFSTIFKMLEILSDENLNDIQEETLYHTREVCSKHTINMMTQEECHYQNIIYFGKLNYSRNLAKCCLINKLDILYSPRHILNPMYDIVKLIYVLRDTIMNRLKKSYSQNYNEFINNTYTNFQLKFNMDKNLLSFYEKQLFQEMEKLIDEYNSFEGYNVKVEHFIRMYVSDNKFDKFQTSEYDRKNKKAEKRKAKNKKEEQS